ncbi:MAG: tetratricopeptide repeat protein [Pyrinomonadaceae bacterium]
MHYAAGLAFYNLRRHREAAEELKQVIALNPKHAPGHFGLALTCLATGDRKGATAAGCSGILGSRLRGENRQTARPKIRSSTGSCVCFQS